MIAIISDVVAAISDFLGKGLGLITGSITGAK